MGKSAHNDVIDGALNIIKNNATRLCICTTEPTTFAEATDTKKLAILTIDSTDFTGPADDTSGRKLTVNEQSGITIDANGNAEHIALCDFANSKLLYVTTCTLQSLAIGSTVNTSDWDISIADPT